MKLASITNRKQSDSRLSKTLKAKFGEDSILVMVECYGLLRCTNRQCLQSFPQLWNRDLTAVLNFRRMMDQYGQALGRPSRFATSTLKRTVSEDYVSSI
ncbi:hypothetical protein G6F70_006344 [Rhizopus microsporus]|nr:hypothetical protein G6F71_006261 [Rhizopus microsporus]KAG1197810.1 hypothetical protein G6F70_006344 [Rhizopus microsporus]KAG1209560.1 hypothetical protein G6F69_006259 [Rhizopus microsporus]KAG1231008.1 hypothetical protein G6F67_006072 [Rhizopus microsporus]KAG1263376.1 hypothetical protein G6F68_005186 [Rhizopus microsporus]